jgi:hypothetical protein
LKLEFLEQLDLLTNLASWVIAREPDEKLKLHIKNARETLDKRKIYDLRQITTVLDSVIPVFKECLLTYLKRPDLSYPELLSVISMINQSKKHLSDESYQRDDEDDDRHEVNRTLLLVLSP